MSIIISLLVTVLFEIRILLNYISLFKKYICFTLAALCCKGSFCRNRTTIWSRQEINFISFGKVEIIQVNLCQKLLFLHQLTQIMMTNCSMNYKFNTWKFQAQTWGEHVVYRNCFWHSPHVLPKEELLTKIYLYRNVSFIGS